MYNRYVPQPDGSFQRNRMQEQGRSKAPQPQPAPPPPAQPYEPPPTPKKPTQSFGIGEFFRGLLPQGLDTADLLIILLILLMAADCEEDRNDALLTLALYFFM